MDFAIMKAVHAIAATRKIWHQPSAAAGLDGWSGKDGWSGLSRRGRGGKFRAVEFRAAQRHEELAARKRARVGAHGGVATVLSLQAPAAELGKL